MLFLAFCLSCLICFLSVLGKFSLADCSLRPGLSVRSLFDFITSHQLCNLSVLCDLEMLGMVGCIKMNTHSIIIIFLLIYYSYTASYCYFFFFTATAIISTSNFIQSSINPDTICCVMAKSQAYPEVLQKQSCGGTISASISNCNWFKAMTT